MNIKKVLLLAFGIFFVVSGSLYAQEPQELTNLHFFKDNALSIKIGTHLYDDSDFTEFWGIKEHELDSNFCELAYERKIYNITKKGASLSLEFSIGYFNAHAGYNNLIFDGAFFRSGAGEVEVENYYISPTIKCNVPAGDSFLFYFGIGPDYYHTSVEHKYTRGIYAHNISEHYDTLGFHGLIGSEVFFYKRPAEAGSYDVPVGFFIEYRYTYLKIDDIDKTAISDFNDFYGTSYPKNEFDGGGHMILVGLRWHF